MRTNRSQSRLVFYCWKREALCWGFPFSSGIQQSRHSHMRELRIQHDGHPYRVLYAFDPRRVAILLLGGDKTGDDRWYEKCVPLADKIYDEHVDALKKESK